MRNSAHKMVVLCLLLIAALAMFVIGTDAAYQTGFVFAGNLITAEFDLVAVDVRTSTHTFSELDIEPNLDYTRALKIDTTGCHVDKMDVSVKLDIQTSGTVPPGFSVLLDGQSESMTVNYQDAQYSVRNTDIVFRWTLSEGEDPQEYSDFSFSYTVTVEGRQKK